MLQGEVRVQPPFTVTHEDFRLIVDSDLSLREVLAKCAEQSRSMLHLSVELLKQTPHQLDGVIAKQKSASEAILFSDLLLGRSIDQQSDLQRKSFGLQVPRTGTLKSQLQQQIAQSALQTHDDEERQLSELINQKLMQQLEGKFARLLSQESTPETQSRIVCDRCKKTITHTVYQCAVCKDFHYCQECEATNHHPHPFFLSQAARAVSVSKMYLMRMAMHSVSVSDTNT